MSSVHANGVFARSRRAVAVSMWLSLAAFVAACALTEHHGFVVWRDAVLSWSTQALAAAYCWLSLIPDGGRPRRPERLLMAAATTAFAAGDAVLLWLLSNHEQPPVPSAADVGYLLFYPLAAAAVVVAVRRQGLFGRRVAWLDTATGALTGATLVAAALGESFRLPADSTAGSVVTGLFPSFDVCFVGLIAAVAAVQGFRLPASWAALSVGFVVFTTADVLYARMLAANAYTVGGLLDPTWNLALALMALWCAASPPRLTRRAKEPADLAIPLVATMIGSGVLVAAATGWGVSTVGLVLAVATILSTAMKSVWIRATGLERLHELNLQRSELLDRLVTAQEAERARLAADVHDEPVQALAAISLRLGLLQRKIDRIAPELCDDVRQLQTMTAKATAELRGVLVDLEPMSDSEDLAATLGGTLATLFDNTRTTYRLDVDDLPPLHPAELTKVTRIVNEALRNVRQHAQAAHVLVTVGARQGGVEVTVSDDGIGVAPETWSSPPGHRGIATMRDRAALGGGWCRLESRGGGRSGTVVRFWLPTPALRRDTTAKPVAPTVGFSLPAQQT